MGRIELDSHVGHDGGLRLEIALGAAEAGRPVRVTAQALPPTMTRQEWHAFIDRTAGAWKGDFERPPQGECEERDPLP